MSEQRPEDRDQASRAGWATAAQVIRRMKMLLDTDHDRDLAEFLGMAAKTIAVWRHRGGIPLRHILRFAERRPVSLDWLLRNDEETRDA